VSPAGEEVSSLLSPVNAPHQLELCSPWQRAAVIEVTTFEHPNYVSVNAWKTVPPGFTIDDGIVTDTNPSVLCPIEQYAEDLAASGNPQLVGLT
jgi:hypothetical protein